jgi:cytidine deaminase
MECRFFSHPDPAAMQDWVRRLRLKAYAPGSDYKVADVLGMKSAGGMVYFGGVNVECLDHRQTVHSEECAIGFMVTAMGKAATIHEAWVMGAPGFLHGPADHPMADLDGQPCGNCRQQILGLAADEDVPIHCLSLNGHDSVRSIGYLLPDAFQFADFDPQAAAEREAARGTLATEDIETLMARVIRKGPVSQEQIFAWLDSLESVDYASRIGQAVIIGLDNGYYVAGVKVENAAYTGINAMQAALGIAVVNFGVVTVREIYTLSKSRRPDMPARDMVYPLSLPSIQGLNEFVADTTIPVTLFSEAGECVVMHYGDAADCFSNFTIQAYRIRDGQLCAA